MEPQPQSQQMQMPGKQMYKKLAVMTALSFVVMYVVMYANVWAFSHAHLSLNKAYMAALMAAPMPLLALAVMGMMYRNRKLNMLVAGLAVLVLVASFLLIRFQGGIGDRAFLNSMIPHHSSAILMCERAAISDPEVEELCRQIVESQRREIDQMKAILEQTGQ